MCALLIAVIKSEILDLEILDDEEAPLMGMEKPEQHFSIFPGQSFEVSGTGNDNFYIGDVVPYFKDQNGTEILLGWNVFSRQDRQEEVRVANPGTFGSLIVATRFYVDYSGCIEVPVDYIHTYVGQDLEFFVRGSDHGINSTDSPSVIVTILEDTDGPVITIQDPAKTLYDR